MTKNNGIIWLVVVVLIIALVIILVLVGGKSDKLDKDAKIDDNTQQITQVRESDWVQGSKDAKVIIIEYADFQCPACAAYHSLIKQVEEKFGSQIGFVYRHFPLSNIHENAKLSAASAEAAGLQGKFWEMHDMIYENQELWAKDNNAKEIFTGYAKTLGLDEDKFKNDIDSKEIRDKISESYREGILLNVTGTPTFFLNGEKMTNPRSFEEFDKVISKELAK